MKLPLLLFLSSTLVSSAPQPNALPRGDPLFGGLISGIANPIIGFKKGLLGLFHGPSPQSSRPAAQRPRPSYGPPAPSVVYHRPAPAPAVAPAPAPAPHYAPKPEIPILPAPDLSGGAPQSAPAVDTYGSPAAPVVEDVDTYGAPAAPAVDTYGSPAAPVVEAAPQTSGDEYGSPVAPVVKAAPEVPEVAPQVSPDEYGSPAATPAVVKTAPLTAEPAPVIEAEPQVEVVAIVDLKSDGGAPEDARAAKSLSSNVPQINIIQVEEVDFKPINTISQNVPVFQTTGPQVPVASEFISVEPEVFQASVQATQPPIIVDLTSTFTSSEADSTFQGAPAIAHIPGQAFEPIVEVREPKILVEELNGQVPDLSTGDDTFEIINEVSSPVLLTTPEPVATTGGPIIIDLVTSDELQEIIVEEVPVEEVVELRSQPAVVEENAIVEIVTEGENLSGTSAPVSTITEGSIELTSAPVVEITEKIVQQTDAPVVEVTEEIVQQNVAPVVEITEAAVIDTEAPEVIEVTEQVVVEQTSELVKNLVEIIEQKIEQAVNPTVEADVTTGEPEFREGFLNLAQAGEAPTTIGQKVVFRTTTEGPIREGVLLLSGAIEPEEGSAIEDILDVTTVAATTLEARQPKALDSDVQVDTGIESNDVSSDEPQQTTESLLQPQSGGLNLAQPQSGDQACQSGDQACLSGGLNLAQPQSGDQTQPQSGGLNLAQPQSGDQAQPQSTDSPVSQLNVNEIVFTTGQPPVKGDFTTAVASDIVTVTPKAPKKGGLGRKGRKNKNKNKNKKNMNKNKHHRNAFHQIVGHPQRPQKTQKFVFRLRNRKPAGGSQTSQKKGSGSPKEKARSPAVQEEVIDLAGGVVLPQDGQQEALVPLLDREAGVFPTNAAPSQKERGQKSLPLGDDNDPAFLEASSNAEPNDPVPRDARNHYYQHQYTDNHANWYYFRQGF